jgi:hypothetical protein
LSNAVIPGVFRLRQFALLVKGLQNSLNGPLMSRIGRRSPAILLNAELVPEGEKLLCDLLRELHGLDPAFFSRLLDLLAMLIDPGQKESRPVKSSMVPCDNVGQDLLVGVPDVWLAVCIVNCRCYEVLHSISRARFCRPRIRCEPLLPQPLPL